jgi:hypothetical protein
MLTTYPEIFKPMLSLDDIIWHIHHAKKNLMNCVERWDGTIRTENFGVCGKNYPTVSRPFNFFFYILWMPMGRKAKRPRYSYKWLPNPRKLKTLGSAPMSQASPTRSVIPLTRFTNIPIRFRNSFSRLQASSEGQVAIKSLPTPEQPASAPLPNGEGKVPPSSSVKCDACIRCQSKLMLFRRLGNLLRFALELRCGCIKRGDGHGCEPCYAAGEQCKFRYQ